FRPRLTAEEYGDKNRETLEQWVPGEVIDRYFDAAETIVAAAAEELPKLHYFRIHGDCHRGNLLRTDSRDGVSEFFFVDFDDFCSGPAVQDFWMLLPGEIDESGEELDLLL